MMQITEDTPPDMLAGAMDLTVHLPNGVSVKMAVERSTPMMDLLVQITTAQHLQLSNHTLQALGMAPSSEHSDRILPFKPNTPIGALDTQHIRVLPKGRTLPAPKYTAPGHQPFESTFRLKVHLPRNQLYVTRVSRNVLLEDIMKKVCEEKNLDPLKYDFKHPGNLDQVLDPKLTLSDYQITEIYVVAKGTTNLSQAFSAADIMVLRKEEERKQMHTKTGGGVFNLIFKRGKSSMGSGSVSSDNRSISPTHSDDSRSVTPPAVQAPPLVAIPKKDPPPDRPKPPQRKRRPAPKPPQNRVAEAAGEDEAEKTPSVVSNEDRSNPPSKKTSENGLTICHSRNSSDSSGYHEASILSDHCANTSLPRNRPRSAFVGEQMSLQSTSNLSKMSVHSRSTTSLVTGRKKKAAPPPPPVPVSPANSVVAQSEKPSPLVASHSETIHKEPSEVLETTLNPIINPVPKPRPRTKAPRNPPNPRPKSDVYSSYVVTTSNSRLSYDEDLLKKVEEDIEEKLGLRDDYSKKILNEIIVDSVLIETLGDQVKDGTHIKDQNNVEDEFGGVQLRNKNYRSTASNVVEVRATTRSNESSEVSREVRKLKCLSDQAPRHFHIGKTVEQYTHNSLQSTTTTNNDFSVEEMLVSLELASPFSQDRDSTQKSQIVEETAEEDQKLPSPKTTILNAQKAVIGNIFTSEEFLKESKPPEVVGLIPKTPKEDKKHGPFVGTFGKKKGLQLSSAFMDKYDPETASISSKRSGSDSKSSRNSVASGLNSMDDDISDLDENMFSGSLSKASTKKRPEVFNQLFGMHEMDSDIHTKRLNRNISAVSLRSDGSISGLNGISRWDNTEELNSVSSNSYGVRNRWVAGDASDTESVTSPVLTPAQTPHDSILPGPSETSTPVKHQVEEKSIESTDSGIAQDSFLEKEEDGFYTPPPPPILDDFQEEPDEVTSNIEISTEVATKITEDTTYITKIEESTASHVNNTLTETVTKESEVLITEVEPEVPKPATTSSSMPPSQIKEDTQESTPKLPNNTVKPNQPDPELTEIDWQYQLPSPPKAFRDSSPACLPVNDTDSVTDFKDSVVTSPELFEKLKSLEDCRSEKDTLKSEVTSIASEEPLNTLSLEHLEKRKSLVYNRELATSLKMTDSLETTTSKTTDNFTSSVTSVHYVETSKPVSQPVQAQKSKRKNVSTVNNHALPNFKISTYDVPKQNIKVFEDDTVRSSSTLSRKDFGRSMENISFSKKSEEPSKAREYTFYRPQSAMVSRTDSAVARSGSFSADQRMPKPVLRSKSTLTLNKPYISKINESNISRSNSLFDVSGLQSLEVMKLIQNKLNTPTGSMENITYREKSQRQFVPQTLPPQVELRNSEPPKSPEPQPIEEKPQATSPQPVKKYYYRGPPSVNMSTWSERPKVPVAVKEDEDYTLGNTNISSKLIVNTTNNSITSNNSIEVRNNGYTRTNNYSKQFETNNNLNGTNQSSQNSNNVVIKIGGSTYNNNYTKNLENQRFVGPTGYRKPFSNINRHNSTVTPSQRPHSIAISSDLDISRVPVVRSVEFKKPFKDFNGSSTSITHIHHGNDDFHSLNHNVEESFGEKFKSTENLRFNEKQENEANKRVFRVHSFKPVENSAPVVRGFKSNNDVNHRLSWNPSSTYSTLPPKPKLEKEYTTNQHVPFSQSTLKRTASSKIYSADQICNDITKPVLKEERHELEDNSFKSLPLPLNSSKLKMTSVPPPPPQLPKVTLRKVAVQDVKSQPSSLDARDMLLDSIRNFGGKKSLKAVKA